MGPQRHEQVERARKRLRKRRLAHYKPYHKRKGPEDWVIL